jgi:uroporphyrinogen-III synthase
LIDIAFPDDVSGLQRAWQELSAKTAVMFVSANAVQGFFAPNPQPQTEPHTTRRWPAHVQAWATGPGTTRALQAAGVPETCLRAPSESAGTFDSEALWANIGPSVASRQQVLIVRGTDAATDTAHGEGRHWLADQLLAAGAGVEFLVSYQRRLPQWSETQRLQVAQWANDGALWLFSSSEALRNLQLLLPQQSWRAARALTTHERIAQTATRIGMGTVRICRPTLQDVLASIKSFQ